MFRITLGPGKENQTTPLNVLPGVALPPARPDKPTRGGGEVEGTRFLPLTTQDPRPNEAHSHAGAEAWAERQRDGDSQHAATTFLRGILDKRREEDLTEEQGHTSLSPCWRDAAATLTPDSAGTLRRKED